MANLPTNIMDFKGFDSSIILIFKGWNSQAQREFPGKFESSNLSRDSVRRENGRKGSRLRPGKQQASKGRIPLRRADKEGPFII